MRLTGKQLIGSKQSVNGEQTFRAANPANGSELEPLFYTGTTQDVDRACGLAEAGFDPFRQTSATERAIFLETCAAELINIESDLIGRAMLETALPQARLAGELTRTLNQLRLFAGLLREGSYIEARIDRALPERKPVPKPDLRQMQIPLGPVAVFGASNFPLAFSVAGGDTASALAAGCPVVVKGHPAHPGTAELAGQALQNAVKACGLPEGIFSLIQGGNQTGALLAQDPRIKALAFTGSLRGGRALCDLAAARPEPIPVYAEMGSVNPLFLLPQALQQRAADLAQDFVDSITLGVGQFCTAPGLLFALKGDELDSFLRFAAESLAQKAPGIMLNAGITQNFRQGVEKLTRIEQVKAVGKVPGQKSGCSASPLLLQTDAATLRNNPELSEEVFGPCSLIVACNSRQEMLAAAQQLGGQLTAGIHGSPTELEDYTDLFRVLERKAGRILVNGFPTGVEVCASMSHGGPYPASSDSRSTSVGTAAIKRFLRPVCYQNFPQALLPEPLRDQNSLNIWRLLDGTLSRENI